jgi:hypothetical protein
VIASPGKQRCLRYADGATAADRAPSSHKGIRALRALAHASTVEPVALVDGCEARIAEGCIEPWTLNVRRRVRGDCACHSKIRLISHRSYGFHSADALIALVYLCCTGIVIELPR